MLHKLIGRGNASLNITYIRGHVNAMETSETMRDRMIFNRISTGNLSSDESIGMLLASDYE